MISEHVSQQDGEGERAWGGYSMTDGDCMCVSLCEYVNATAIGVVVVHKQTSGKKIAKYFIELMILTLAGALELLAVLMPFQCKSRVRSVF